MTTAPSELQSTMLVASREVKMRLRSKAFVVSSALMLLMVLGSIIGGGLYAKLNADTKVAVVGDAVAAIQQLPGLEVVAVDSVEAAKELVRDGAVKAAVVPDSQGRTPIGLEIIADREAPSSLIRVLSVSPPVTLLNTEGDKGPMLYLVSVGFGVIFFASAMTFGMTIAQSVVEEKQTRVVEILMSAIPVRTLLAGKVIGNSILALAQTALTAALVIIGLTVIDQTELLSGLGMPIVWFVIFFTVGFVLLAAMFAATGSMVARQEDLGSTTSPVTMLVMLPYFLVIFFNSNPTVLALMSYVPFSAPVAMPVRLFIGSAQWWEPLVSLLILAASTVAVVIFGSKIYANSLLRMGGRVKLGEALRG